MQCYISKHISIEEIKIKYIILKNYPTATIMSSFYDVYSYLEI